MCARFSIPADGVVASLFGIDVADIALLGIDVGPIFNFAPSRMAPALVGADRELTGVKWGIDLGSATWKGPLINIKSETAGQRFKGMLENGRCLVPATGFFEWETIGSKKQPWRFVVGDAPAFAFASLVRNGTFAVMTTEPNDKVSDLHDRMPCVLLPEHFEAWLSGSPAEALELAQVSPDASGLRRFRVDTKMGNPRFEDASVIEPLVDDQPGLF